MEVEAPKREASENSTAARKETAEEMRDANYAAAKENCEKYSGDVKDRCTPDAKVQFAV